jgi:hypothetical protein
MSLAGMLKALSHPFFMASIQQILVDAKEEIGGDISPGLRYHPLHGPTIKYIS